jgi:hypothetical protein
LLDVPPGSREASTSEPIATPQAPPTPAVRRANRRIGLLVVAGMLVLGVAALIYMINTRHQRGLRTLDESPALGYLPDDTNVILIANPAIADNTPEGREMLYRLGLGRADDAESERRAGQKREQLDWEGYTGRKREQIESLVLGLKVDTGLIPHVRLVVRTNEAYDADKLRERLQTTHSRKDGNKTLDYVKISALPIGEPVLWCAAPRTYVICLSSEDMAKVPDQPSTNVDRFVRPIPDLLRSRSDKEDFLSVVAHSDHWEKTPLSLLVQKWPEEDRKLLFKVRTVGVGLRADRGATTSRQRPARITEEVKPEDKGIAADIVFQTNSDLDTVAVRDSLLEGVNRLKLSLRDSSGGDNRFSAEIFGTPAEWDAAIKSIRDNAGGKK